jgi:hypothetical protein
MDSRQTIVNMLRTRRRQRGGALIIMLVIFVLGASWLFIEAFGTTANRTTIQSRTNNAAVLMQAKLALTGWVANKAVEAGENNPGRVPCPEAPGYIGTANEGVAAGNCSLPAVGRLPWRTLGLSKLLDSSGEPLWYVVSQGWALPNAGATLTINSNSLGQLTLDGVANAAVALIIAPGSALNVGASSGCTARVQTHNSLAPDVRDYLECENADADSSFVTSKPSAMFNDQVVAVTTSDILPGLEAAISKRIEREIVPALRTVYGGSFNVSATTPVYPYAAPFADPGPGSGTSNYQGVAGTYQGLLPFNQTLNCSASASNPRCLPNLVTWAATPWPYKSGGSGSISGTCYWEGPAYPLSDARMCEGTYSGNPVVGVLQATFSNVALGLRALDASKVHLYAHDDTISPFDESVAETITTTTSVTLNSNGTATLTVSGPLPDTATHVPTWGTNASFRVRIERSVIGDNTLLNANDPTTGWFVRNEWFRLLYYAIAQGQTAASLPSPSCTTGTDCLTVGAAPDNDKRALLLLEGRSLGNQSRPSSVLANFLETAENTNLDTLFVQPSIAAEVNDRVIVVDHN